MTRIIQCQCHVGPWAITGMALIMMPVLLGAERHWHIPASHRHRHGPAAAAGNPAHWPGASLPVMIATDDHDPGPSRDGYCHCHCHCDCNGHHTAVARVTVTQADHHWQSRCQSQSVSGRLTDCESAVAAAATTAAAAAAAAAAALPPQPARPRSKSLSKMLRISPSNPIDSDSD